MSYKDQRGFTDSHDNQKSFNEKYIDSDSGPYMATVKYTKDPLRMGRLGGKHTCTLTHHKTHIGPDHMVSVPVTVLRGQVIEERQARISL